MHDFYNVTYKQIKWVFVSDQSLWRRLDAMRTPKPRRCRLLSPPPDEGWSLPITSEWFTRSRKAVFPAAWRKFLGCFCLVCSLLCSELQPTEMWFFFGSWGSRSPSLPPAVEARSGLVWVRGERREPSLAWLPPCLWWFLYRRLESRANWDRSRCAWWAMRGAEEWGLVTSVVLDAWAVECVPRTSMGREIKPSLDLSSQLDLTVLESGCGEKAEVMWWPA